MNWTGIAAVISSLAAFVTAAGVIVVAVIARRGATVLRQVEKQGNSQSLEFKRLIAVSMRRTAAASGLPTDNALAEDSEKVYEEAKAAAEREAK